MALELSACAVDVLGGYRHSNGTVTDGWVHRPLSGEQGFRDFSQEHLSILDPTSR